MVGTGFLCTLAKMKFPRHIYSMSHKIEKVDLRS